MFIFSILALIGLIITPGLSLQRGALGFALGSKKPDGTCKYTADYEADFDAIKTNANSTLVRGYSSSDCDCAQQILPAAKSKGFKVVLGVWPDTNATFTADKEALQSYVPEYPEQVYAVTVGSKSLYRGTFTGPQLLAKINDVKAMLPNTKVGTADSWNKFADGTADALIRARVDILMANAFPYWQGENAGLGAEYTYVNDLQQALSRIKQVSGSQNGIEFWNGETGWPTDGGTNYGPAKASTKSAATMYTQGICSMLDWGVNVFYFEAFDEPWKPAAVGDNGQAEDEKHWGAMTANRTLKPGFQLRCPM